MERLKSLDPPHKGLRNALAKFAILAGKTNYESLESVRNLQTLGTEVFHLLKDHNKTENEFILKPLEEKLPRSTDHFKNDHKEIDAWERNLETILFSLNGQQRNDGGHSFYVDFCNFQSHYLAHINEEDITLEHLMQSNFSDEELMQHQIAIMQQMPFETLLLWFKYIVPARRAEENAQVLRGFKSNAPIEAFNQVIAVIKDEISAEELQQILDLM